MQQSVNWGAEQLVNTFTDDGQTRPRVAGLDGGGYVIVWDSPTDGGATGLNIVAQVYDAFGEKVGGEFVVNENLDNHQMYSSVAALDGGGFVVVWESGGIPGELGNAGIAGRSFDASGNATAVEFWVNSEVDPGLANGNQAAPVVVRLDSGGFAVAYTSAETNGDGHVKVQIFDADATKSGGEIVVTSGASADFYLPTLTALGNGTFAVAWTDASDIRQ